MRRIFPALLWAALLAGLLGGCGLFGRSWSAQQKAAMSALENGEYTAAIQKFDGAIAADESQYESYFGRACAWSALAGSREARSAEWTTFLLNAADDYRAAAELGDEESRKRLPTLYCVLGDASVEYARTLLNRTEEGESGAAFQKACADAEDYFRMALDWNHANAEVYGRLASLYLLQGDALLAEETLDRGVMATHDERLVTRLTALREEREAQTAQEQRKTVSALLRQIPYYGDVSACVMTREQAEAYRSLIVSGIQGTFRGFGDAAYPWFDGQLSWDEPYAVVGDASYETDRAMAALCDFAGDGNPYLYLCSSLTGDRSFTIYGWNGTAVKQVLGMEAGGTDKEGGLVENAGGVVTLELSEPTGDQSYSGRVYRFQNGTAQITRMWDAARDPFEAIVRINTNGVTDTVSVEEWEASRGRSVETGSEEDSVLFQVLSEARPLREMAAFFQRYAEALGGEPVPDLEASMKHTARHRMAAAMLHLLYQLSRLSNGSGLSTAMPPAASTDAAQDALASAWNREHPDADLPEDSDLPEDGEDTETPETAESGTWNGVVPVTENAAGNGAVPGAESTPPEDAAQDGLVQDGLVRDTGNVSLALTGLMDFDNDGTKELYAAFYGTYQSGRGIPCQYIIYRWEDGALREYPGGTGLRDVQLVRIEGSGDYGLMGTGETEGDAERYVYTFLSRSEILRRQGSGEAARYSVERDGELSGLSDIQYEGLRMVYKQLQTLVLFGEKGEARGVDTAAAELYRIRAQEP